MFGIIIFVPCSLLISCSLFFSLLSNRIHFPFPFLLSRNARTLTHNFFGDFDEYQIGCSDYFTTGNTIAKRISQQMDENLISAKSGLIFDWWCIWEKQANYRYVKEERGQRKILKGKQNQQRTQRIRCDMSRPINVLSFCSFKFYFTSIKSIKYAQTLEIERTQHVSSPLIYKCTHS